MSSGPDGKRATGAGDREGRSVSVPSGLFCVKMRASRGGTHVSGAEKIVAAIAVPGVAEALAARALAHPKGAPDDVRIRVEPAGDVLRLPSLPVRTFVTRTAAEGMAKAAELLAADGLSRIPEIFARFRETYPMRGAMLLDADTLERLEPDLARGVRATRMDDADSSLRRTASGKNHYAEAVVLATKVQAAPGIVAELCVSDDPDYVTGYVASSSLGYCRITTLKQRGDPAGGRIFLYRGPREGVSAAIDFLERRSVLVEGVPSLPPPPADPRARLHAVEEELAALRSAGLARVVRTCDSPAGPRTRLGGRDLLVLSSNDYLDLARDPRVVEAAVRAARTYGTGTGGARLTTGSQPPHDALERRLAAFKGTDDALLFGTGYMANVGAICALVGRGDAILSDERNHASLIDGCRLSRADLFVYRHGDMDDLERNLAACREHRRRLVVSDGVFSMDGDLLDLPRFLDVARRYNAFTLVDEAHATGVIGATGRGLCEHFGCGHPDLAVGTLSKALGAEGGFVCGATPLIELLRNKSRPFIFSTSLPAPVVAAADAALAVLEAEPERVAALRRNAALLVAELAAHGLCAATQSAIVPIPVGDEVCALRASEALREHGVWIPAIRYPTVPRGAAILRASVMSSHTQDDLRLAATAIAHALAVRGDA